MIAVATNILVYAHREDSMMREAADRCLTELAENKHSWAIPWPCIHEFLAITTHPRIYDPPTPLEDALEQIECWLESPSLVLLGETRDYWSILQATLKSGKVSGPQVHDGRIVCLCRLHGVTDLWSANRDFTRFPAISTTNPLTKMSICGGTSGHP